jgi:hypothetical protein
MTGRAVSSAAYIAALALAVSAAPASASPSHFSARPLWSAETGRLVVRETVFHCVPSGCTAPRSADRPEHVCAALAREIGPLASFSAGGRALDEAALAACNRRAR